MNSSQVENSTKERVIWHDWVAGLSLLTYGIVGLVFYTIIIIALYKLSKEIAGFRILLSDALANTGQVVIFAVWPGILILLQMTFLPKFLVAILNDGFWFCMSEHYLLISFSRYVAIVHPFWFNARFKPIAYPLCFAAWVVAFCQSLLFRFMPWKTLFYYNPQAYGFVNDEWVKYGQGEVWFWNLYNFPVVFGPFLFYFIAAYTLYKKRSNVQAAGSNQNKSDKAERKLLIPCFVNQTFYFFGSVVLFQLLLKIGNKWGSWAINVYQTTNSLVNPVMLVFLSSILRNKALTMLGLGKVKVLRAGTTSKVSNTSRRSSVNPDYPDDRRASMVSQNIGTTPIPMKEMKK